MIYVLNIVRAIKNMSDKEIRNFNFEKCYKQFGFSKESNYYSIKHLKKRFVVALK